MFENAELKIGRAEKHIQEFNSELRRYIHENPHTVLVKFAPQFGCDLLQLYAPKKPLPVELALPIGDAIHNLHTALDFMWYGFVSLFDTPSEYTKFPFRAMRQDVIAALNGKKIPQRYKPVEDYIVDVVKPYEGSDTHMWDFHNLDITDKHEYLIPDLKMVSIWDVRAEAEDGTELPLPRVRTVIPGWPPQQFRLKGERNTKITDQGKMTVNVLFYQGPLQAFPVEPTLIDFAKSTRQILEDLRTLIGAIPL